MPLFSLGSNISLHLIFRKSPISNETRSPCVLFFFSKSKPKERKPLHIFSSSSVVVDSFFFFVLLFFVTTTTTNFRSPQLFRPASFKIPATTIEFLSSSSTKALNLFLDGRSLIFEIFPFSLVSGHRELPMRKPNPPYSSSLCQQQNLYVYFAIGATLSATTVPEFISAAPEKWLTAIYSIFLLLGEFHLPSLL